MVVILDSQIAGISGDMLLCSLVDIGASKSKIIDGVHESENFQTGSKIQKMDFEKIQKHGIAATHLVLDLDENFSSKRGMDIQRCINDTVKKIGLSQVACNFANASINTLVCAESKIHSTSIDSVHFHEASSLDTVIDIVGVAIALDDLGLYDHQIISTPVAVGSGMINFSHGVTSNPASAILEIFKNSQITIFGTQNLSELVTPTGASMLVNLAQSCCNFYPSFKVANVGYGAGDKNFDDFSNVFKIVQGTSAMTFSQDSVKILETNVDDISGEVLGHVIEKIMAAGAKDVTVTLAIGKKGRPTNVICVICDSASMDIVLEVLISETGTLGVRVRDSCRVIVPRTINTTLVSIDDQEFTVRYKTTENSSKIESDDIKHISVILKKSFKDTEQLIKARLKDVL